MNEPISSDSLRTNRILYLLLSVTALLLAALVAYINYTSLQISTYYAPLVDAAMEIKLEATKGHLVFEEMLSGDRDEKLEEVYRRYAEADWYAKAMLEGGTNPEGSFKPLEAPEPRSAIGEVRKGLEELEEATARRYEVFIETGAHIEADKNYDRIFNELIIKADEVETEIQKYISLNVAEFRFVQICLSSLFVVTAAILAFAFYRLEVIRRSHIHELDSAKSEAEKRQKDFKTIADFTYDWEYWIDSQGNTVYVSPACERISGYRPEEFFKDPDLIIKITHPDDAHKVGAQLHRDLPRGQPHEATFRIETKSGEIRWLEHNCQAVVLDGRYMGRRGSNRDITSRKEAEAGKLDLERQVQQAQKLESLGVMAGGIAHDFNNILMGVLGNAELAMLDLSEDSPVMGSLKSIESSAQRAADLAKQMLAYSGKGRFVVEPVDINRMIEEMSDLLKTSVSTKAAIKYHLAEKTPLIDADLSQTKQVFMNLITNASEALGDGEGVIAITTGSMEINEEYLPGVFVGDDVAPGLYTFIEVSDDGCGMDEETQRRIFDPFFTTKFTGRGLGMAATLGIVKGHRGAIKIYSEVNEGSTVKILFPCSDPEQEEFRSTREDTATDLDWRGEGTILVVDDDETVRAVALQILAKQGFEVVTANDGKAGVDLFAEKQGEIKMVLLDMTMPRMGGEEAFREIRRIAPEAKVILSSGYNEQEATNRFAGEGLAGFLQKPYRPTQLLLKVKELLEPGP